MKNKWSIYILECELEDTEMSYNHSRNINRMIDKSIFKHRIKDIKVALRKLRGET